MITIVDIYTRVSTDDQNDGYSPRFQEETLRRYCELKGYHIRKHYHEDHSAKSFQRPVFSKMLMEYRKQKGIVNLLLFTKWDRFSRNAGDAYAMISTLNKLGIEPFSVEQPIDISIPEQKIMLAFYLASPEVENHRRALNVTGGMRRAMKEGRYMGKAPLGYINQKDVKNKWIEPDPRTSQLVIDAFEEVASGKYSVESVLRHFRSRGLRCSKNNFWNILRNPVYYGKILVPPYKGEPAELVPGQHRALISADIFYQVQDILDGKKKSQRAKKTIDDRFPLRGFLRCHTDGRLLTASASKGRKRHYEYYHCTSACGTRYPAGEVHEAILQELARWTPDPAIKALYELVLDDVNGTTHREQVKELKDLNFLFTENVNKTTRARQMLLDGQMDPDDFRALKADLEASRARLEARIAAISELQQDIKPLIQSGMKSLEDLAGHFQRGNAEIKRQIIDSIFPEKLEFDGHSFRTARVNEAVRIIFNLGAAFSQIKTGQEQDISALSREVIPMVQNSNLFLHDLRKLARLQQLLMAS